MDNKKFEKLIDLIINEDQEQAKALFHDIVVEKSREIYESLMEDDINDMISDISSEEDGSEEDEFSDVEMDDDLGSDEFDGDDFGDDDFGDDDFSDDGSEVEELEDRVVDLEDKLDELMAEFEEMMGSSDEDMGDEEFSDEDMGDEDMGDEEFDDEEFDDEEFDDEDMGDEEFDDEEALAESVELQRIKGLYDSKIGGDNGAYTKSPALTKPKVVQTGANPVNFTSGEERGRTAPTAKQIPGQYKNAAGIKSQDGESAPKATTSQATGVNTKSPVAESKRTTRRSVTKQYK